MLRKFLPALLGLALAILSIPVCAGADDNPPAIRFQNGRFEPTTLIVPADQPLQVKVVNGGDQPIEFESFELNRERVVAPGQSITVFLRSLSPGTYHFFDDFHHDAGEGTLVAR